MKIFEGQQMHTIKSLEFDQSEILRNIVELHCDGRIECDVTYGNGVFYKNTGVEKPYLYFDIDPQEVGVIPASSVDLPISDNCLSSLMFDPPFLTYVRKGRDGNGNMKMARRFGGYWKYSELMEHYTLTIKEASRVLKKGGVLIVKCQDIIHNHRIHPTHINVNTWAERCGFRLLDLFVLGANHRLPSPNRKGKQKHARIFHSYFMVFKSL